MRLRVKENVDLKKLEEFGFKTFLGIDEKTLFAVRDIYIERNNKTDWYRIGVDEEDREFRKSKHRPDKCLLSVEVTKKDIQDLIQSGLVEKVIRQ